MKNQAKLRFTLFISLVLAAGILLAPSSSPASVSLSVTIGPPALPVYEQPLCPGPGFIWTPGYWAWDPDYGYYWVPGAWMPAPFTGALWTPGYWGWNDGVYIWHEGYWGPVVGFYGGINYGFGYTGTGYYGGYWRGNTYYYNRTVNNVNVTNITNVYSKPVVNVRPWGASFNGGHGGTTVRPTPEQAAAARERRASITSEQKHHMQIARDDPEQRAAKNHGRPAVAATMKPGEFKGHGVVRATRASAPYKEPSHRQTAPRELGRTPGARDAKHGDSLQPSAAGTERAEPRTSRRESERMQPGTPRRGPARMEPRVSRRQPERMAPGITPQEKGQRFDEPRAQRQRQKPAKPLPQRERENNRGERGEPR